MSVPVEAPTGYVARFGYTVPAKVFVGPPPVVNVV
jgi:hypothetical protein